MARIISRLRKYCSDSAIISMDVPRVLNVSFNEQSCNLNCRVCGFATEKVRTMYARRSVMDRETLDVLVSHLPTHRNFWFDISAIAETLQFRDLGAFIAELKRRRPNVNTVISTSGTLLTARMAEELVESGLDFVQFSLYAPDAEGYKFITQSEVPFERTLEKLDLLVATRGGRAKPVIHVFIYDTLDFRERAAPLIARYESRVNAIYFRPLYDTAGVVQHGMSDPMDAQVEERYPCPMLWYSGAVRSNGDYLRCYPMHWFDREHRVGNVRSHDLRAYWRALEDARALHLAGRWDELPGCQDCDVWNQVPSFFSRRADGSFYIPKTRLLLSVVINWMRRYWRTSGQLVSH